MKKVVSTGYFPFRSFVGSFMDYLVAFICYLFSQELNFAKMEQAYFAGLNFRDLAKKYVKNVKNVINTYSRVFNFAIFLKIAKIKSRENK